MYLRNSITPHPFTIYNIFNLSYSRPPLQWPQMKKWTTSKWTRRRHRPFRTPCRSGQMCDSQPSRLKASSPDDVQLFAPNVFLPVTRNALIPLHRDPKWDKIANDAPTKAIDPIHLVFWRQKLPLNLLDCHAMHVRHFKVQCNQTLATCSLWV